MNFYVFLLSALLLISPALTSAQSTPRNVGVVDVGKVFDEYYKVKEAKEKMSLSQNIFKEEMGIYQSERKKLIEAFSELQTKLKNPNLDTEILRKKGQEMLQVIREKEADIKQYQTRTVATMRQREQNFLALHTADIREAIKKVAASKNLDLILSSAGQQLVLFAKPAFDVTADVSTIINASAPKK